MPSGISDTRNTYIAVTKKRPPIHSIAVSLLDASGAIQSFCLRVGYFLHVPPLPIEIDVKDRIQSILHSAQDEIDIAIELCLYAMKTQIFIDGNKRASVIWTNHYLIAHGQGFLVIPEEHVPDFKRLLVRYYEGEDIAVIRSFLKANCWRTF